MRDRRLVGIAAGAEKSMQVLVEEYDNFDSLGPMQQEWDGFVESVCGDIFMTFDWCRIWWKYYGKNRNLRILIFRCDDQLVGIVPLFFEKIWLGPVFLKAIKIVGSDFTLTQFSLPIKEKYLGQVVAGLADNLKKVNWDIIHMGLIAGICGNFGELKESLRQAFDFCAKIQCMKKGRQVYVQLAEDPDVHLRKLSKNQRRTISRSYREINSSAEDKNVVFESNLASIDCFEVFFDDFTKMHQSYWQRLGMQGHFSDWPNALDFHRDVAKSQLEHGRLRLLEIKLGDVPLGYEYDYKFGNRYYAFLNARANNEELNIKQSISLGCLLYGEQISNAINENVQYIDMMRGEDDYKLRLGGEYHLVHSICLIRKGCLRGIRMQLFRLLSKLYDICYYRIWFFKVAPKIMKTRGSLWAPWIRSRFFS